MTDQSSTPLAVPVTKRSLLTLSHAMERAFDIADQPASSPALVLGLFQRREYFDVEAARYAAMAAAGTCVVVGFAGSTQDLPPGVHAVGFTEEDPRSRDWVLITVKGAYASSLVATDARDLAPGELSLESARLFHARWTFQRLQALADAQDQLTSLAPDLPDALRSIRSVESPDRVTFELPVRPDTPDRLAVVIGSGFAGFFAARRLLKADLDLTVLSASDGMLYAPLLPDVAVGAVNPRSVVVPPRLDASRREPGADTRPVSI